MRALRGALLDVPLVGALVSRFGSTSVPTEVAESFFVAAGFAAGGPAYDAATWYMHVVEPLARYPELVRSWPMLDSVDDFEGIGVSRHRWYHPDVSCPNDPLRSLRCADGVPGFCRRCGLSFDIAPYVGAHVRLCTSCARRLALVVKELVWFRSSPFRFVARASCVVCLTPMARAAQACTCGASCRQTLSIVRRHSAYILRPPLVLADPAERQPALLDNESFMQLDPMFAALAPARPVDDDSIDPDGAATSASDADADELPVAPGPPPVLEVAERQVARDPVAGAPAPIEPRPLSSPGWTLLEQSMALHFINSAELDRALDESVRTIDREVAAVRARFERLPCQVVALSKATDPSLHASALPVSVAHARDVRPNPVGYGWSLFLPDASFSVTFTALGARCDARLAHQVFPLWSVFVSACCGTDVSVLAVELRDGSPLPRLVCLPDEAGGFGAALPSSPIESFCPAIEPVLERMARCPQSRCRGGCGVDPATVPAG